MNLEGGRAQLMAKVSIVLFVIAIYQLQMDYRTVSVVPAKPQSYIFVHELSHHEDEEGFVDTPLEEAGVTGSVEALFQKESNPTSMLSELNMEVVHRAREFLQSRKQAYEDIGLGKNWHLRGIAYLSEHRDMLLAGELRLPEPPSKKSQVVIHNVHTTALERAGGIRTDCHLLEVWVRVRGPEIFAGTANAVQPEDHKNCYWTFDFDLQVSGEYIIESKVLLWNGKLQHDGSNKCVSEEGNVSQAILEQYPVHIGFRGFKLYNALDSCCEFCSRQINPPCRYWSTPPVKMAEPSFFSNGCEFYFDKGTTPDEIPFLSAILGDLTNHTFQGFDKALGIEPGKRRTRRLRPLSERRKHSSFLEDNPSHHYRRRRLGGIKFTHGYPHNASTSYFVGCGWHQMFTLDFPCISGELDDKVILAQENITYQIPTPPEPQFGALPLCQHKDELMKNSHGRWVKEPWPNQTQCPNTFEFDKAYNARNLITLNDPFRPHCWHRDDLSIIGYQCGEMNCKFIWPDSRWISSFRESQWMAVWRQYNCDYLEFTDAQLQKCVDAKKISEFKFDGASVAKSFQQCVGLRLQNLRMHNYSDPDSVTVTLSTLMLLHQTTQIDEDTVKRWESQFKNLTGNP